MRVSQYNLLGKYKITVVNNKVEWVTADEFYPELEDGTYSDQVHTHYRYGKGEVVDRILILYTFSSCQITPGDASDFYKSLHNLPLWNEAPWYIYAGDTHMPAVQYTRSGRSVGLVEAMEALKLTGYSCSPEIDGFERIGKREKPVKIFKTIKLQEAY